jgi:hypothetical protein
MDEEFLWQKEISDSRPISSTQFVGLPRKLLFHLESPSGALGETATVLLLDPNLKPQFAVHNSEGDVHPCSLC